MHLTRSRRAHVALAACVVTGVLLTGSAGYAATGSPWAQTDSDGAHSRFNATETTLSASTVVHAAYRRSLVSPPLLGDDPCDTGVSIAPVLTGGVVYSVVSNELTAWTASSGARLWQTELDATQDTHYIGLAVASGHVVVGSYDCHTEDPVGSVASYSTGSGALQWSKVSPGDDIISQIAVSGSAVVGAGTDLTNAGAITAFDLSTGSVLWNKQLSCLTGTPAVVVGGNAVYETCDSDGNPVTLTAAKLTTGTTAWTRSGSFTVVRGDTDTSAAHHLYVTTSAGIVDLNPATGATRYTLSGSSLRPVAVDATNVYVACPAGLCAYTRASGAPAWSRAINGPTATIAVANGLIYTPGGDVLRTSNGTVVTTLWSDPATYVSVGDGRVAAVTDARIIDLYGSSTS